MEIYFYFSLYTLSNVILRLSNTWKSLCLRKKIIRGYIVFDSPFVLSHFSIIQKMYEFEYYELLYNLFLNSMYLLLSQFNKEEKQWIYSLQTSLCDAMLKKKSKRLTSQNASHCAIPSSNTPVHVDSNSRPLYLRLASLPTKLAGQLFGGPVRWHFDIRDCVKIQVAVRLKVQHPSGLMLIISHKHLLQCFHIHFCRYLIKLDGFTS